MANNIDLDKTDIGLIVKEVQNEIANVEAIYLFGSLAKGKGNPDSDYDIAIIVKKYPGNDLTLMANIKCALFDKIKRPIDIVILENRDLMQPSVFLYELYHNHIKLFGRDLLKNSKSVASKVKPTKPIVKSGPVWYYV